MLKTFMFVQICFKAVVFHRERLLYSMKTTAPKLANFFIRTSAKTFRNCAVDGSSSKY